jgi:hypothetical protein
MKKLGVALYGGNGHQIHREFAATRIVLRARQLA